MGKLEARFLDFGGNALKRGDGSGDYPDFKKLYVWLHADANIIARDASGLDFRDAGALSVIGRALNSEGKISDISATPEGNGVLRESSNTLSFGLITNDNIDASAGISISKLGSISANRFIGSVAGGAPSELTPANARSVILSDASNVALIARSGGSASLITTSTANRVLKTTSTSAVAFSQIVNADIASNAAIAISKLATISANRVLGSVAGGAPSELTPANVRSVATSDLSALTHNVLVKSGSLTSVGTNDNNVVLKVVDEGDLEFGKITDLDIEHRGITYFKLPEVTASRIIGRGSASGNGNMQELTAGNGLTISGTALQLAELTATWEVNSELEASSGTNAFRITNLPDPLSPFDATNKRYVDSVAAGLKIKGPVKAASVTNLALSGHGGGLTVDGITINVGDRILLKDQTDKKQNGIYVLDEQGDLNRSHDFDADSEVQKGTYIFVEEGSTQANRGYVVTTDDPIEIDTDEIEIELYNSIGQIENGFGIARSGNVFSVDLTANFINDNKWTGKHTFANNVIIGSDTITGDILQLRGSVSDVLSISLSSTVSKKFNFSYEGDIEFGSDLDGSISLTSHINDTTGAKYAFRAANDGDSFIAVGSNNGNFGVGTSSPTSLLHVAGTGKFEGVLETVDIDVTGDVNVSGSVTSDSLSVGDDGSSAPLILLHGSFTDVPYINQKLVIGGTNADVQGNYGLTIKHNTYIDGKLSLEQGIVSKGLTIFDTDSDVDDVDNGDALTITLDYANGLWFKGNTDEPTSFSPTIIRIGSDNSNTIKWDKDNESLDLNKSGGGYFKIRAVWDGDPIPTSKIADFSTDVLNTLLDNFDDSDDTSVTAADSILEAIGKLQAQIDSLGNVTTYEQNTEHFQLDANDISNKYVILEKTPKDAATVKIIIDGAPGMHYLVDYEVIDNTTNWILSWNGLGLDGLLEIGDNITVFYDV